MIVIVIDDDGVAYRVHRVDSKTKASVEVTEEFEVHQLTCRSDGRLISGVFVGRDVTEAMKGRNVNAVEVG